MADPKPDDSGETGKPTLFITGAGGFLGRSLLAKLDPVRYGAVYCLDRRREQMAFPEPKPAHFHFVRGDILDPDSYQSVLAKCDTVMHLAAVTGKTTPAEYARLNAYATMLLLDRCKAAGVRRFLFVSSIAVSFENKYRYFYAHSKEQAEVYVRDSGLNYCIVRPTIITGPGAPVFQGLAQLASLPVIPVFGSGKNRIQPIHVDDAAKALRLIEENNMFHGETLELGGPEELALEDFLRRIAEISKGKIPRVLHLPAAPAVFALSLLERLAYRFLPLTAGQLATFRNDGLARENGLIKKMASLMRPVETQIRESLPPVPATPISPELKRECAVFVRYLTGLAPNAYIFDKYFVCHEKIDMSPRDIHDRLLLRLARIRPLLTRGMDVYSRFLRPVSTVRRKLAYLMAILEVTPPHYRYYDSASSGKAGLILSLGWRGVTMVIHLLVSALFLAPVQIAVRVFGSKPSQGGNS